MSGRTIIVGLAVIALVAVFAHAVFSSGAKRNHPPTRAEHAAGSTSMDDSAVSLMVRLGVRLVVVLLALVSLWAMVWGFSNLQDAIERMGWVQATGLVIEKPDCIVETDPFNWNSHVCVQYEESMVRVATDPSYRVRVGDEIDFYINSTSWDVGGITTWEWYLPRAIIGVVGGVLLLLFSRKLHRYANLLTSTHPT